MTPTHRYEVRVRNSVTRMPFTDLSACHAEWAARCEEGQQAELWQWMDATAEADAGWDCLLTWLEFDDLRDEQFRRYDEEREALREAVGR